MQLENIIMKARSMNASDIHISVGNPIYFRIHGELVETQFSLSDNEIEETLLAVLDSQTRQEMNGLTDLDFALKTPDGNRQRVNYFHQQKNLAATIRLLDDHIPSLEQLNLPTVLGKLAQKPRGLILVTGPTGSGKSTTLAAMIDSINSTRAKHIITVEDPIEYVYETKKSLIHQREVGRDVKDFASSLRSALREDPDVILVGEMRDYETISAALTAAETGHLVMSTLHTTGAAQTIDRIIDACPAGAQNQIRSQLSGVLCGIITQTLVPLATGGGRCAATEILIGTDAVLNIIREDKCHQLGTNMQSGAPYGMHSLNADLTKKVRSGTITRETAFEYSNDPRELNELLGCY